MQAYNHIISIGVIIHFQIESIINPFNRRSMLNNNIYYILYKNLMLSYFKSK